MEKTTILIVDDDAFVRDILADILDSVGYSVDMAENGALGFERFQSNPEIDLIISDIHMPVMDGLGLINKIRKEAKSEVPLIVLSGNNEVSVAIDAINSGANDYLLKDENLQDTVVLSVENTLEKKRIIDENRQLLKDITSKNAELKTIVERMTEIGIAVTSEKDFAALMDVIITHARALTSADAGTLYLIENQKLEFKIVQNETLRIQLGGKSGDAISFPPVDITESNVSGYVALKRTAVNIPDVYQSELFDFTGPKNFDKKSNYRSKSMLVVPMINRFNDVTGVLQLLNATDPVTQETIPFSDSHVELVESLASQAAVALTNLRLEEKTEQLLEEVMNIKNYNESILESLTNGVITLDNAFNIITANAAALRILNTSPGNILGMQARDYFTESNHWILNNVKEAMNSRTPSLALDVELEIAEDNRVPMNLTFVPLNNIKKELIGSMMVLEDITTEKRVKGTLARYMTKEVADKLMESGEAVLGGKLQEASVLFSDIRDFTTITEELGPQETVAMLNDYFTLMVEQIFQKSGILDKYIGDALLAVFGAPFQSDRDADNAVESAIGMMRALVELNEERARLDQFPIRMGIGINTDEILTGNIGSIKRMDYTCIGDGVNLASRLEGLNKYFGTNIIISDNTYKKLKNTYQCRKIDLIRVKGKQKPVIIYEVLDFYTEATFPNRLECVELFHEGLNLYQLRNWDQAILKFEEGLRANPRDEAAQAYIQRSEYLKANPRARLGRGLGHAVQVSL